MFSYSYNNLCADFAGELQRSLKNTSMELGTQTTLVAACELSGRRYRCVTQSLIMSITLR